VKEEELAKHHDCGTQNEGVDEQGRCEEEGSDRVVALRLSRFLTLPACEAE
jgi:hypothetical protein